MNKTTKKWLGIAIQAILILGIFGFLFWQASSNREFGELLRRQKHWHFLLLAVGCNLASVLLTFWRWRWLVRAMEIPLSQREMLRIGFVGYLFNLAPAGIVSGDLVKILMLARKYPAAKERVAASVLVDRAIGLYVMFLTSAVTIFATGFADRTEAIARISTQIVLILTLIATVCVLVTLLPSMTQGRFRRLLSRIPWCGGFLHNLVEAFRLYRQHPVTLIVSTLVTIPVHVLLSLCVWAVARGFFQEVPGMLDHIVMHTIANLTSMIPLAVGPYEAVLNQLYPVYLGPSALGIGLIVALGYRLSCLAVAGLGIGFYLANRGEVDQLRNETEAASVFEQESAES